MEIRVACGLYCRVLNLPVPNSEICIMWDWMAWTDVKLKIMTRDELS